MNTVCLFQSEVSRHRRAATLFPMRNLAHPSASHNYWHTARPLTKLKPHFRNNKRLHLKKLKEHFAMRFKRLMMNLYGYALPKDRCMLSS